MQSPNWHAHFYYYYYFVLTIKAGEAGGKSTLFGIWRNRFRPWPCHCLLGWTEQMNGPDMQAPSARTQSWNPQSPPPALASVAWLGLPRQQTKVEAWARAPTFLLPLWLLCRHGENIISWPWEQRPSGRAQRDQRGRSAPRQLTGGKKLLIWGAGICAAVRATCYTIYVINLAASQFANL